MGVSDGEARHGEASQVLRAFSRSPASGDQSKMVAFVPSGSFPWLRWIQTGGVDTVFPRRSRCSLLKGTPVNIMHLVKQQAAQFLAFFDGARVLTLAERCFPTVPEGYLLAI